MRRVRLTAVATIGLVGVYFVLRALASSCTGAACDGYIPMSLLIPILIFGLAGVTGVVATIRARGHGAWVPALVGATLVGVAGPIAALVLFRDHPDSFVLSATVLVLIAPAAGLVFSFWPGRSSAPS